MSRRAPRASSDRTASHHCEADEVRMASDEYRHIRQLIARAAEQGWTELDLSRKRLTQLPPELLTLRRLKVLYIRNNFLSTLPDELGNLDNLQQLFAQNNRLQKLPASIGQLVKLTNIELYGNELTALVPELFRLVAVRELILAGNRLTELPREVGLMVSLIKLDLKKQSDRNVTGRDRCASFLDVARSRRQSPVIAS
jgi:Leucine-rich repeat (LRR) protein